jgi:RNA polymerase sigma factor (TIGR02999 family)
VPDWQNRKQFFSLAAQIMRRVLVDHARQRAAQRRGDGAKRMSLHDTRAALELDAAQALDAVEDDRVDMLAIDAALTRLQLIDGPQSRIVELRYFGGLSLEETASVVGISIPSVKREWVMARAWLRRELAG